MDLLLAIAMVIVVVYALVDDRVRKSERDAEQAEITRRDLQEIRHGRPPPLY